MMMIEKASVCLYYHFNDFSIRFFPLFDNDDDNRDRDLLLFARLCCNRKINEKK